MVPVLNCNDVIKDTKLDGLLSRSVRSKKQALILVVLAEKIGWLEN